MVAVLSACSELPAHSVAPLAESTPAISLPISLRKFQYIPNPDGRSHIVCSFAVHSPDGGELRYNYEPYHHVREDPFLQKCYDMANGDNIVVQVPEGPIKKYYWRLPGGETMQFV